MSPEKILSLVIIIFVLWLCVILFAPQRISKAAEEVLGVVVMFLAVSVFVGVLIFLPLYLALKILLGPGR